MQETSWWYFGTEIDDSSSFCVHVALEIRTSTRYASWSPGSQFSVRPSASITCSSRQVVRSPSTLTLPLTRGSKNYRKTRWRWTHSSCRRWTAHPLNCQLKTTSTSRCYCLAYSHRAAWRSKTAVAVNGECLSWTGGRCRLKGRLVGNFGIIYAKCEKLPGGGLGWKLTRVHRFEYMLHVKSELPPDMHCSLLWHLVLETHHDWWQKDTSCQSVFFFTIMLADIYSTSQALFMSQITTCVARVKVSSESSNTESTWYVHFTITSQG